MSQPLTIPLPSGGTITIDGSQLPSPLILVSPQQAQQFNNALYIHIGATGIYVWDILNNLRNDFKLITEHKVRLPTMLYFVIRLSFLFYVIGKAVLLTAQIENCQELEDFLNVSLIMTVSGLTTFFYLRIVTVYNKNPYIVVCFGITWLSTLALLGTVFLSFSAAHFSASGITTKYCHEAVADHFDLIGTFIVLLVNDLLIYIAISYRIYRIFLDYDFQVDWKRKLVILLFGTSLPVESKIVLLESQLYCLVVVFSKIFIVTMVSIDRQKNSMYIICHLVLTTVLASRVYRELRQVVTPQHRTDFQTGNLTSAEFGGRAAHSTGHSERAERSLQERASRKTAEIEDDLSSIGGTTTRSTGLDNSSFLNGNRMSDDFNARTLRCGEDDRSNHSKNARQLDEAEVMNRV